MELHHPPTQAVAVIAVGVLRDKPCEQKVPRPLAVFAGRRNGAGLCGRRRACRRDWHRPDLRQQRKIPRHFGPGPAEPRDRQVNPHLSPPARHEVQCRQVVPLCRLRGRRRDRRHRRGQARGRRSHPDRPQPGDVRAEQGQQAHLRVQRGELDRPGHRHRRQADRPRDPERRRAGGHRRQRGRQDFLCDLRGRRHGARHRRRIRRRGGEHHRRHAPAPLHHDAGREGALGIRRARRAGLGHRPGHQYGEAGDRVPAARLPPGGRDAGGHDADEGRQDRLRHARPRQSRRLRGYRHQGDGRLHPRRQPGVGRRLEPRREDALRDQRALDDMSIIDVESQKVTKSVQVGRVPHSVLVDD